MSFEGSISPTSEPGEPDAVVQIDKTTKLVSNFADLARHQRSISASRFFEKLRETGAYHKK